jgi:hypothetical protein
LWVSGCKDFCPSPRTLLFPRGVFFILEIVVDGLQRKLVGFQENPGWIGWKLESDPFRILNGQVGGGQKFFLIAHGEGPTI